MPSAGAPDDPFRPSLPHGAYLGVSTRLRPDRICEQFDVGMGESEVTQKEIVCVECSSLWLNGLERWRFYLTDDVPPEVVPLCPKCARREFGD